MALRLSPLFPAFASTYPDVRLIVNAGITVNLVDDVVDGRLDGAFVTGPIDHPDLYQEPVFREDLVLVSSRAVPSLKALARDAELKTIVFQRGCAYRQRLETLLSGMGLVLAKPLEFGSLDAIIGCVSAGVGVTLLPKGVVAPAAAAGKVVMHALPKEHARADTLFIRRTDSYVSSAMTAFLDMARGVQRVPKTPRLSVVR
jgi:DNA-binding transcriptional LysR family regulator